MSKTARTLLVAVVAVAAVGGYWKFVLAPKRVQADKLETQVLAAKAQLSQQQQLIKTYQTAQAAYKTNYATVVRLGKAIPADDDTRSLVVQLDAAAKRSGINFDTLDIGSASGGPASSTSTGAAGATENVTPGAVNLGSYSAIPFNLAFTGTYSTLGEFFGRLERFVTLKGNDLQINGRMLRIDSLSLLPADNGWPGLTASIGASAYIVPESTDGGAGATATTPPSTTSTAATTTTSSTSGSNLR